MEEVTTEETMVESAGQDDEPAEAATAPDETQAELAELRSALEQRDLEIQSLQSRLASANAAIEKRCSPPLQRYRRSWSWESRRKRSRPPWQVRGRWWRGYAGESSPRLPMSVSLPVRR